MKRIVGILLLATYLLTTTEAHQFFKLPELFSHYLEHQKEDASIGVFDFLAMHYASDNAPDADHDRDMELPFKSFDGCPLIIILAQSPKTILQVSTYLNHFDGEAYPLLRPLFLSSAYLSSIWQPPRSC